MNIKSSSQKPKTYHQKLSYISQFSITIFFIIIFTFIIGAWTDLYVTGKKRIHMMATSTLTSTNTIIKKYPLNCNTTQKTCPLTYPTRFKPDNTSSETCPDYFKWIQQDLKTWEKTGITRETLERAKPKAHFRVVIKSGRLYIQQYEKCFQTRDVFTIWGIGQLLRMYPGQVPDLELLFFCNDIPTLWKREFSQTEPNATWPPPPLFQYCSHLEAYGIVFPDWSFWGWPEVNIKEWTKLSMAIREANKRVKWEDRVPYGYWKGNYWVSQERVNLMKCNFSDKYDPMIRLYQQDWGTESATGFKSSNLEDQCTHRYKIYIEGQAWSVSKKYIVACDSMTLLIKGQFYDFFSRSMVPLQHYWPIKSHDNCGDLKFAVEWGNNNTDKAKAIGRQGSEYIMKNLKMKYVYDYMLYVLQSYGKLMKLDVTVPENATEVCLETMACPISKGDMMRQCMDDSLVLSPSVKVACDLPPPYGDDELKRLLEEQEGVEKKVEKWGNEYWEVQNKRSQQRNKVFK